MEKMGHEENLFFVELTLGSVECRRPFSKQRECKLFVNSEKTVDTTTDKWDKLRTTREKLSKLCTQLEKGCKLHSTEKS